MKSETSFPLGYLMFDNILVSTASNHCSQSTYVLAGMQSGGEGLSGRLAGRRAGLMCTFLFKYGLKAQRNRARDPSMTYVCVPSQICDETRWK